VKKALYLRSGKKFGEKEKLLPFLEFFQNRINLNLLKYHKVIKQVVSGTQIAHK